MSNEASAKNNTGVNEIFQKIVQKIDENKEYLKENKGVRGDTVRLGNNTEKSIGKQKKKCKAVKNISHFLFLFGQTREDGRR